jgi:hypothetical protein
MRTPILWFAMSAVSIGSLCAARTESSSVLIARTQQKTAMSRTSLSQSPASSLQSRAEGYWARREAKDLSGAYPFYCSAYRARVPLAQFLQMTRLVRFDLRDIRVSLPASTGDRAEVTIAYRFLMPTLGDQLLDGQTKESWVRDSDGQWCKEDEPVLLPFPPSLPTPPPGDT